MSNPSPAARVAENVLSALRDAERSVRWLASKLGMPYSTLRLHLNEKPENLTLITVVSIAGILDVPLAQLVPDDLVDALIAEVQAPRVVAA